MTQAVGFIGLGNMGAAIAARLLERGWELRVWNRTPQKAAPLVAQGAVCVGHPEDAALPGGIVLSMLADDAALDEQFGAGSKLVHRLGHGGVHISLSTIHPDTSRRLAQEHERSGVVYLGSPVFGRPEAARTGSLWIALSGPAEARRRARPLLDAIGRGVTEFGDDPGAANVAKLCGNFLIAAATEALGEAAALAEKSGVGAAPVLEMLVQTLFSCPLYQRYGKLIVAKQFQPAAFRLRLGLKDVELAVATARSVQMPLPLGSFVRDRCLAAINKGRGDWDWTAVTLEAAEDAGL